MLAGLILLTIQPAVASETEILAENNQVTPDGEATVNPAELPEMLPEVIQLNEIDPAVITVDEGLMPIAQADWVEITDVQIDDTPDGFVLRLETVGELATPETSVTENTLIVDIPNAVLQLPDGDDFFSSDPTSGIALINVANLPDGQVQIAITGSDAPPTVDISVNAAGLTLSGMPGNPSVQAPDDGALRIVVTGEQDEEDYFVPDASTATRTDTPLRDIPNSIQVIPRQVIEDQQATSLPEVLENAAGVTFVGNNSGRSLQFGIRGLSGALILQDGFILPGTIGANVAQAGQEVANLERVEVLRGPASVLYGQAEPGGVINIVTKQPLAEPYYNLQLQGGNLGFVSPSLDFSGPLNEDSSVRYRLNALYRREEGFRDFNNDFERFFIAPTLAWDIGDRTNLTVSLEYTEDNEPQDWGLVAVGEGIADIPFDRVLNDPNSTIERDSLSVGYTLEHRFSDDWQLRNQFRYITSSYDSGPTLPIFGVDEMTGDLTRIFAFTDNSTDTYALNTNVQGRFDTGPLEHTVLFGVDLYRLEYETSLRALFGVPTANIFDPDISEVQFPPLESFNTLFEQTATTKQLAIYLQDQIDILDNLILVAGVRYDTVDTDTTNNLTDVETNQYNDALTPRIGIVYQPIEPISLYANYSRSFRPNPFSTDVNGDFLEPEAGEGFEVGIRGELIENRLAATLAYFDITKQNVATTDPNDPTGQFSIAVGEQRSRGVDFNLTGEILPGWNVVASYAYIDATVTEDNTDIVGNRLIGIPEHSASLWTTYEIQSGGLQGLGFGLGVNFVGERQGDLASSFQADSYFLTNAAVFYRRDDWNVRLNVDNLFDVNYIESVGGGRAEFIYPGAPLTMRASVSYTF
ncbi:MAG: TonB-dependent receptor [Cyanobacteria bacterium P01_B01_bin.77]